MGLIPEDVIRELRERTDIVAVIGQHVSLRKAGRNHKGLCPFHNEKTPSFNVSGDRGFFYCFGCQKKGDVFTFLMEYEGKSFIEAAESLAAQHGIEIPRTEEPESVKRQRSDRTRMLEINKLAAGFYRDLLRSDRGAPGRAYLESRGIGDEVAEAFQLGWAPDEWRALSDFLQERGASLELAGAVGLVAPQPRAGGHYDKFRSRLMCPVIVPGGEVAGFSGRIVGSDAEAAKYINSPESPVYKKSRLLFGLAQARESFRGAGRAVLVEGNFDVISLHQAGFTETVAPLGTALTDEQAGLLKRFAQRVVLLYDADKAGHAAALKSLEVLMGAEVDVYIATLPSGEDPDSMVKTQGAAVLAQLLDRAQIGVEYFAYEVFATTVRSPSGRARTLHAAAQIARSVRDPVRRNLIVDQLATGMRIDRRLVWQAVGGRANVSQPTSEDPRPRDEKSPESLLRELQVLAILADHPQLIELAEENDVFSLLTDERLRDMYCAARRGEPIISALPAEGSSFIAEHVLSGAFATAKDPRRGLLEAVASLRKVRKRPELAELQRRAQAAKRRGDVELERELVREILSARKQVD